MRVIIAGSRNVPTPLEWVRNAVRESGYNITTVISGTARGVDRAGEEWAKEQERPVDVEYHPAQWDTEGRSAGYKRNERMGNVADALIAVWDGKSAGTYHMIRYMKKLGKPVFVLIPGGKRWHS